MPVAPVADQIDDHIFAEFRAVIAGKFNNVNHAFRVFSVHVKDRYHEHLGNVGGVSRGTGIIRQRGIANLVVDNNMNSAPGAVSFQLGHIQSLGHNTLTGKSGVTVDEKR